MRAVPLLLAALLTGCSAGAALLRDIDAEFEAPAHEPSAPSAAVSHTPAVAPTSTLDPAPPTADSSAASSPRVPVSAGASNGPVRLPPLELAGLDEIREVTDPLSIAHTIDLTASPDDLWERIRTGFGMRDLSGPLVLDRQIWYASRPSLIKNMLQRSRRYLYHIVEELERRGMPSELALLPMVESAFNPMAYSRAKASGLWQFIPSTGRTYNLKQNWWIDARRDVVASTAAALDYLQFLYEMHGDWHLALASYNWGENSVTRAIARNKASARPTDYLSLRMPAETRYYVPKLQALKNIVSNPAAFGIDLDPIPNKPYFVTVEKKQDIDIRTAAKLADLSIEELIALNPAYNRPVVTAAQSQTLVLPADRADTFRTNLENHDKPLSSWRTYTLNPGERLARVAARHGITLARLRQVNGIGARSGVRAGQQILVPVKGSSAANDPFPAALRPPSVPGAGARKIVYSVQNGDSLWAISRRYGVRLDDLKRWNTAGGRLAVGQKIVVYQRESNPARAAVPAKKPPAAIVQSAPARASRVRSVYVVKKGDSLWAISRRFRVRVDDLRLWNTIGQLLPGQKIVIYQRESNTVRAAVGEERAAKAAERSAGSAVPAKAAPKEAPG